MMMMMQEIKWYDFYVSSISLPSSSAYHHRRHAIIVVVHIVEYTVRNV